MTDENQHDQNANNVEVSSQDAEFTRSVEHGVMEDDLNYRRLFFWTGFIIAMVAIFFVALIELYDYSAFILNEEVQKDTPYAQIEELEAEGNEQLGSFGVVDAEQEVYHIPIDSAIHFITQDSDR